ncbi:LuxR C-terminal-related transcriptional regulator [Kribbella sp. NPDC056951]|uniref:helix-turn-helix transcriptional regulator n=1 Tax=Kribbella sp. NPDC056951 TaxID=3345978 RepID=UPI00363C9255
MAEHELRGRERELAVLQGLVDAARTGRSGVLVVRGEVGVGKSALLDALTVRAQTCRVADAALEVFEQDVVGYGVLAAGELVEAASRTGDTKLVETALSWLNDRVATDWGLGLAARASALLSADEDAYLQSLGYLERTPVRVEVARGRLLYGEWLRREGRRVDAREQLRTAHDLLTGMGLQAFADRARHELLATGETVRKRTPETRTDLTAQESQIATLARDGLTNPEIAAQLFISPRTVEWHLRKTFAKLGIKSRRQLRTALQ